MLKKQQKHTCPLGQDKFFVEVAATGCLRDGTVTVAFYIHGRNRSFFRRIKNAAVKKAAAYVFCVRKSSSFFLEENFLPFL